MIRWIRNPFLKPWHYLTRVGVNFKIKQKRQALLYEFRSKIRKMAVAIAPYVETKIIVLVKNKNKNGRKEGSDGSKFFPDGTIKYKISNWSTWQCPFFRGRQKQMETNANSFLQISLLKMKTMVESNLHLDYLPKQIKETNDHCFAEESWKLRNEIRETIDPTDLATFPDSKPMIQNKFNIITRYKINNGSIWQPPSFIRTLRIITNAKACNFIASN